MTTHEDEVPDAAELEALESELTGEGASLMLPPPAEDAQPALTFGYHVGRARTLLSVSPSHIPDVLLELVSALELVARGRA